VTKKVYSVCELPLTRDGGRLAALDDHVLADLRGEGEMKNI
jgi:hypothetical protein